MQQGGATTDVDISLSHQVVDRYLHNDRTIILAVIAANNSLVNQVILEKAKGVDPSRTRTMGIITKPDIIMEDKGHEEWMALIRGREPQLGLGWHAVVNKAKDNTKSEAIDQREAEFFQRPLFAAIGGQHLGLESLKERVTEVVHMSLVEALPDLEEVFETKLSEAKERLLELGSPRISVGAQRCFMLELGSKFSNVATAAIDGAYSSHDFFFNNGATSSDIIGRKLRARTETFNHDYNRAVWLYAASHLIEGATCDDQGVAEQGKASKTSEEKSVYHTWASQGGKKVSWDEAAKWALAKLVDNRGTEIPGEPNQELRRLLCKELIQNWESLTKKHVANVKALCDSFAKQLLEDVVGKDAKGVALKVYKRRIFPLLRQCADEAYRRLAELSEVLRHDPKTHDPLLHFYAGRAKDLRMGVPPRSMVPRNGALSTGYQQNSAQASNQPLNTDLTAERTYERRADVDRKSADEALYNAIGCYTVLLKGFIENVRSQIIEDKIVKQIPKMLPIAWVSELSDAELESLTAEPSHVIRERAQKSRMVENMEFALEKFSADLEGIY
jgi:hypothetical protein